MKEEPLSPLAQELFSLERKQPTGIEPTDEAAARVLLRLEALGLPPSAAESPASPPKGPPSTPSVSAASTALTAAGKVGLGVALLTVGAVMGSAGTLWMQSRNRPPPAPLPSASIAPPEEAPEAPTAREAPTVEAPIVEAPIAEAPASAPPPLPPPHVKRAAEPPSTLREEQVLLDTARAALVSQRASDALSSLEHHARAFPSGELAEQREALAVQALVLSGDLAAARTRAAAFKKKYPQSVFLAGVEAAVLEVAPP